MNDIEQSQSEVQQNTQSPAQDKNLQSLPRIWPRGVTVHKYHCNFI